MKVVTKLKRIRFLVTFKPSGGFVSSFECAVKFHLLKFEYQGSIITNR